MENEITSSLERKIRVNEILHVATQIESFEKC